MPYDTRDELPDRVRDNLTAEQQDQWMAAFNAAWDGTCADAEDREECAVKVAWAAVEGDKVVSVADRLAVKVLDPDKRIIEGYATLWNVEDHEGEQMIREAIEPYLGRYLKTGVLFWEHQRDSEVGSHPIGKVLEAKCDDVGLWIKAQVYKGNKFVDYAWNYIKQGIRGLSVGAIASAVRKVGQIIKEWPLFEISVTGTPAVPGATFSLAKALATAKTTDVVLDPQLSAVGELVDEATQRAAQSDGAIKARWQEALVGMQSALEADDIKRVTDIYDQTNEEIDIMAEEAKNAQQEELNGMVAKAVAEAMAAQRKAEQEAAEAKAAEEERINKEVEARLEEQIKAKAAANPALKRELYPEATEEEEPEDRIQILGPYEDKSVEDLMTSYMVGKAAFPLTGTAPSRKLYMAIHGKMVDKLKAGEWHKKEIVPDVAGKSAAHAQLAKGLRFSGRRDNDLLQYLAKTSPERSYEIIGKADELMGSDVSGAGDEWIPQAYSRQLIPLIRQEARVHNLFPTFEVPGESLTVPTQDGTFDWYKTGQVDDLDEMDWGNAYNENRTSSDMTNNMTLTPSQISAVATWAGILNEQSLVDMGSFLRQDLVKSAAETWDEILISGDTDTTSSNISDYGNGAISTSWRLLLANGLRDAALSVDSTNSRDAGAMTAEDFPATMKLMGTNGEYAEDISKLALLMDLGLYWKLMTLGELLTEDKFGRMATIENGMITRIFGVPVIASAKYASTDSSGYINNSGGSNTKGSFMFVRPDQGAIGWGRNLTIDVDRWKLTNTHYIVGHFMMDFQYATDELVGLSYNVTV